MKMLLIKIASNARDVYATIAGDPNTLLFEDTHKTFKYNIFLLTLKYKCRLWEGFVTKATNAQIQHF